MGVTKCWNRVESPGSPIAGGVDELRTRHLSSPARQGEPLRSSPTPSRQFAFALSVAGVGLTVPALTAQTTCTVPGVSSLGVSSNCISTSRPGLVARGGLRPLVWLSCPCAWPSTVASN